MRRFRRSDDFRAGRRTLALGLLALIVLAVGLPSLWRSLAPRPSSTSAPTPPPQAETLLPDESAWERVEDTVRRGDTFSGLLLRNRLGMQEIARVLEVTRRLSLFSPRALQPGQTLALERDEYGVLRRMVFSLSPEETYVYEARGDSLLAWLQPVEREVRLRKFEGTIHSSVDEAIHEAGGDTRLTMKFADTFAYDIDFFTEVHKGDHFSLLVEERFVDGRFLGYGEILYGVYDGRTEDAEAVWFRHASVPKGGYYSPEGKALRKSFLRAPLNYRRISSQFSKARFHPIRKTWRPHHGVDYAAATGTPVVAVADGTVSFAGWKGGYGKIVQVRHSGRTETAYGHLSRFANGVRSGARVSQGQVIGYVGRTGMATGPHLHYEVVQNGVKINPLNLKNVPADPLSATAMGEFLAYAGGLEHLERSLVAGQVIESFDASRLASLVAALNDEPQTLPLR